MYLTGYGMGKHKDPWALDIISKIKGIGNSLGYVTTQENAAKLVPLKPLIYCHIFKPPIVLTKQEITQLSEIHHGTNILIYDGNTDLNDLLKILSSFNKARISKQLVAYVMVEVDYTRHSSLMRYINSSPEIISAIEIHGNFDILLEIGMEHIDISKVSKVVRELSKKRLVKRSYTFIISERLKYT